ncbi:MAG: xanthine dehydrogenase accessory protein XdhC [Aureliella sp.]
MSQHILDHTRKVQELLDAGRSFVTITLVDIRGSAPQILGAKAIVTESGIESGTVGGGKIEAASIVHAQELLSSGASATDFVTWNLQTDIGMTCGGEVKLFFEVHAATAWPIAIFGAGHVAQALVRLLIRLNCHVTCVDPRPEWLDRLPTDPKLATHCTDSPKDLVAKLPSETFFVLMSKGHATDLPVLAEVLRSRIAPFVGVIGSAQKASVLRRDLSELGLSSELINTFHCPIGLPFGNNTPQEIAISITAQLLQQRDKNACS